MKMEWRTHFAQDKHKFLVILRCTQPQRASKWQRLVDEMGGSNLSLIQGSRYTPLLAQFETSANKAELEANRFTIDMLEQPEAPPKRIKGENLFEEPIEHPLNLDQLLKARLPKQPEPLRHLRRYDALETHRRVLFLEGLVGGTGVGRLALEGLAPRRERAFAAPRYLVVDPITLCVPVFLSQRLGDSVAEVSGYRIQALAASLQPLLDYGEALQGVAAELGLGEGAFDLTGSTRAHLAGADPQLVDRRRKREQADAARVPDSPLLALHARVLAAAERLLARDTHALALTKHLPPTPSMREARYNVELFLAQLAE